MHSGQIVDYLKEVVCCAVPFPASLDGTGRTGSTGVFDVSRYHGLFERHGLDVTYFPCWSLLHAANYRYCIKFSTGIVADSQLRFSSGSSPLYSGG